MVKFDKISYDSASDNFISNVIISSFVDNHYLQLNYGPYQTYSYSIQDNVLDVMFHIKIKRSINGNAIDSDLLNDMFRITFEFVHDNAINLHINYVHDRNGSICDDFPFAKIESYILHLKTFLNINKITLPDNVILSYDGSYNFKKLYSIVDPTIKYVYIHEKLSNLRFTEKHDFFMFCFKHDIEIISRYGSGVLKNLTTTGRTAKIENISPIESKKMRITDHRTYFTVYQILYEKYKIV